MESHLPPNISSFVIRFVIDSEAEQNPATYRGAIRHIQTDEELTFSRWEDVENFIRRFVPLESGDREGGSSL
ncbi:MAG: hypothetical protein PVJ21_22180 [Anaerolineales bacterium]|jgi:hypothetical protein